MSQNKEEPVSMFNNGCLYYAHTTPKGDGLLQPKEVGFYMIVFYEEFSEKKVIASFRGPVIRGDEKPYVRKIVDKETPVEKMQDICLDTLVSLLRKDKASEWYKEKVFVPGEQYEESIQDYIRKKSDFPISANYLTLPYFSP